MIQWYADQDWSIAVGFDAERGWDCIYATHDYTWVRHEFVVNHGDGTISMDYCDPPPPYVMQLVAKAAATFIPGYGFPLIPPTGWMLAA
jgi:hypothetical protein